MFNHLALPFNNMKKRKTETISIQFTLEELRQLNGVIHNGLSDGEWMDTHCFNNDEKTHLNHALNKLSLAQRVLARPSKP